MRHLFKLIVTLVKEITVKSNIDTDHPRNNALEKRVRLLNTWIAIGLNEIDMSVISYEKIISKYFKSAMSVFLKDLSSCTYKGGLDELLYLFECIL